MDSSNSNKKETIKHFPIIILSISFFLIVVTAICLIIFTKPQILKNISNDSTINKSSGYKSEGVGITYDAKIISTFGDKCIKDSQTNTFKINQQFCNSFDGQRFVNSDTVGQPILPNKGLIDQNHLYIFGAIPNIIYIFDASDTLNIKFISSIKISDSLAQDNRATKIYNNKLYTNDGNNLLIYDVSNILNIPKPNIIDIGLTPNSLDILNNYLYITTLSVSNSIKVYSLTNPLVPKLSSTFKIDNKIAYQAIITNNELVVLSYSSAKNDEYQRVEEYKLNKDGSINGSSLNLLVKSQASGLLIGSIDNNLYISSENYSIDKPTLWAFQYLNGGFNLLTTIDLGQKFISKMAIGIDSVYLQYGYASSDSLEKISFNFQNNSYHIDIINLPIDYETLNIVGDASSLFLLGSYSQHTLTAIK